MLELARYTDHRGREHRITLAGDLVLDCRRGSKTLVVADLRSTPPSGKRRDIEQIVRSYTRQARKMPVLRRPLQTGELAARQRPGQLTLPTDAGEDAA